MCLYKACQYFSTHVIQAYNRVLIVYSCRASLKIFPDHQKDDRKSTKRSRQSTRGYRNRWTLVMQHITGYMLYYMGVVWFTRRLVRLVNASHLHAFQSPPRLRFYHAFVGRQRSLHLEERRRLQDPGHQQQHRCRTAFENAICLVLASFSLPPNVDGPSRLRLYISSLFKVFRTAISLPRPLSYSCLNSSRTCPPLRPRPNCLPSLYPGSKSHLMTRSSSLVPEMYRMQSTASS